MLIGQLEYNIQQYIQISLFHSDHTNMTYEEYNTILKGGTYLNRQIKERERDRGGEEVKYKDINI